MAVMRAQSFQKKLTTFLQQFTKINLDVPFRTVSRGSLGALPGFPGSPGVRSQKVRGSSRRLEKVREGSRRFENVREGSRRFEKVRKDSRRFEKMGEGSTRFKKVGESSIRLEKVREGSRKEKVAVVIGETLNLNNSAYIPLPEELLVRNG